MSAYKEFTDRLKLLFSKNPDLIVTTLSNIFTMRLIGNKTHGDLAEIAISEFINQYMYDFKSQHVGKDLFRAKSNEEDISVTNEITQEKIPVSLKAYGDGPLQLSTDKNATMFPTLEATGTRISGNKLVSLWNMPEFSTFGGINILPLIYDENKNKCNILVFNAEMAKQATDYILYEKAGHGRKHPVYRFYDKQDGYICEVRYGSASANALQRGLWTHTKKGFQYFDSLTDGWVSYSHNLTLVALFSHALVSTEKGHQKALAEIKADIAALKKGVHK